MDTHSQRNTRKRKLAMVLPLLVLPFATLIFWALDGGQAAGNKKPIHSGLDLTLPTPKVNNRLKDKRSLYEQAEQQARRLQDAKTADPYSRNSETDDFVSSVDRNTDDFNQNEYIPGRSTYSAIAHEKDDDTEAELRRQLAALKKQLNIRADMKADTEEGFSEVQVPPEITSLTDMEQAADPLTGTPVYSVGTTTDPELQQLDNMLTKILDIEHPQRVRGRLQQQSREKRGQVFPVETKHQTPKAALLQQADIVTTATSGNAFYESHTGSDSHSEAAVPAMVQETQSLVSGGTLKLRLAETVFVNGRKIPAGNLIYGACSLEGERLKVSIKHICYKETLLPVDLSVYDMDAIEGIHIPGAITRDAAKQGMAGGIQNMNLYNMDPSLGAQAASAGVQTVKSLLGHKVKLVKVTVRAGYPVLLVDNNKPNQ